MKIIATNKAEKFIAKQAKRLGHVLKPKALKQVDALTQQVERLNEALERINAGEQKQD